MEDPKEKIKRTVNILSYTTIILGSFMIFLMASLTHHYIGGEGETWFQVYGLVVAIIIAHYIHKCLKDKKEIEERNDVQK